MTTAGPRAHRTVSSDFRRWTRIIYITLPFLLLLNYFIIFQWAFFESLAANIFPSDSFHPAPFAHTPHGLESHDKGGVGYWTWDTPTRFRTREDVNAAKGTEEQGNLVEGCETFPTQLLDKIQVVLKVGAADHISRTESQLASVVKCIPNLVIVSDNNRTYGDTYDAIDILASLPPETYLKEEDYDVYARQKNTTPDKLKQGHDGWKIDKYKFLAEVEYAATQRPDAEWFVFLESDTYIFWDNVFRLLDNYDHALPYYFGSPSPGRKLPDSDDKVWFAYGGCGFIISQAAARRFVDRKRNSIGVKGPRVTEEYKEDIRADCCGDSILGWALHDKAGVDISGLFPMFNPHSLSGLPFGKIHWCEPVISLHKTGADQMKKLWDWEMSRDRTQRPLLFADLIDYHNLGNFTRRLDWDAADWDGFAEPDSHPAHKSLPACETACNANKACYQWTYHGNHCHFAWSIRMGHHKDPSGDFDGVNRRFTSGWDVDKIQRWKRENTCAEGAHWVKPSVKRKF